MGERKKEYLFRHHWMVTSPFLIGDTPGVFFYQKNWDIPYSSYDLPPLTTSMLSTCLSYLATM